MTYATYEILGSEPVELIHIAYGTSHWYWTSSEQSIVKGADTYVPTAVVSGRIAADEEAQTNFIELTVDPSNPVAVLFVNNQPSVQISVTIFRKQRSDAEFITVFQGIINNCIFEDEKARLVCSPMQDVMKRKIGAMLYQPTCNNRLFDNRCQVVKATWTFSYAILSFPAQPVAGGQTIQLVAAAGTFFSGAKLNWLKAGTAQFGTQRQMITDHTGDTITLIDQLDGVIVGSTLTLYAGCDKLNTTCRDKFSNLTHFEGFANIPVNNPFTASLSGT